MFLKISEKGKARELVLCQITPLKMKVHMKEPNEISIIKKRANFLQLTLNNLNQI